LGADLREGDKRFGETRQVGDRGPALREHERRAGFHLAMTLAEAMKALEAAGTDQARKIYRRHGMPDPMFGVSYATLGKLQKRIGPNHALARALWRSGNSDARLLAMMVVDPGQTSDAELDGWAKELDWHGLADAFIRHCAALTLNARHRMDLWMDSDSEWTARAAWGLLAALATQDKALPDDFFQRYLVRIEHDILSAKNRVREAMNSALIAIGSRNAALARSATTTARRIGKVEVDHGDTACKTPDAVAYIKKLRAQKEHRARRPAGRAPAGRA
jgi:3-methyladenine DNA glycosylase AlkD